MLKKYREQNKTAINAYSKNYYKEHKEQISAYNKAYHNRYPNYAAEHWNRVKDEVNKERRTTKVECPSCKNIVNKFGLKRHMKSKKCMATQM